MSAEFDWPFEISGFGGGYEARCRKMAKAGVLWLREHPGELARWRDFQRRWEKETGHEYVPRSAQPRSHVEFMDAVAAASGGDCTGAMLGASSAHAVAIFERGWDGYVAHVTAAREKAGQTEHSSAIRAGEKEGAR